MLIAEPFARPSAQLLQTWLLGPEAAQSLAAGSNEPPVAVAAGMKPPPPLPVPGMPIAFPPPNPSSAVEAMQAEILAFRRDVALGNWSAVQQAIEAMPPDAAKQVYEHLLRSFGAVSTAQPAVQTIRMADGRMRQIANPRASEGEPVPTNYLSPEDVLGMADAAPAELSDEQLGLLAAVMQVPQQAGFDLQPIVERINVGVRWLGGQTIPKRIAAAKLFLLADQPRLAGEFLPAFDQLDRTNVKLLQTYGEWSRGMFGVDGKPSWLQGAWECYQAIVENRNATTKEKYAAIEQLVLLAPQVQKEIGQAWLDDSFRDQAELGRIILSLLGTKTSGGLAELMGDPEGRTEWLRLQNRAIEALLAQRSDDMSELSPTITLMSTQWLREARTSVEMATVAAGQPYMQVDVYGNYYWIDPNEMQMVNRQAMGQLVPIPIRELIELRPKEAWIATMDESLRLAIPQMLAQLYLRINDESSAFPQIELVAKADPLAGQMLVDEFLTTWTANHDPNNVQRQRNPYIYFYGFEARADSIPLTRSKQERNLLELGEWVERIRRLPIEKVDESKLASAFSTCHSSAEVFRLEAIESVFGDINGLKPETVAAICQTMRSNLANVWRSVRTQEANQTRRREPDVQQEVLRGYEVASEVARRALASAPDEWRLTLVLACLAHDANDYAQSVQKSSEYSARRLDAFSQFARAADQYRAAVSELEKDKQSTSVFDYWFYAALGAVDLGRVTDETVAANSQFPLIHQAILALPGDLAEKHLAEFANNLFTRMSPIKPEMKFRYLNAGFEIVGDHPRASEARQLFMYYQDLLSELRLVADIDGSDVVGHEQPFGVFVVIHHTAEIERESAGFAKYLQNQNVMSFSYNYGRPTEDYRDKFETAVREDLAEHFEVLSVTFEDPKNLRSRPGQEPGWRITPYAYLLLKPLGPQVDKLPAIKLDLDFLDTSGFVVMPIATAVVPIDASSPQQPRPYSNLEVTQTLDERQAADGRLILEVKATAKGLAPELDQILKLQFPGFDTQSIDAQPVLATQFDPESDDIQMLTDRSWSVELTARPNEDVPSRFQFASAIIPDVALNFQRYQDADLVKVDQTVDLKQSYAVADWSTRWWIFPLTGAGLLILVGGAIWLLRRPTAVEPRVRVPDEVNPFTVLALLRHIKDNNGLSPRDVPALERSIVDLEEFYFGQQNGHPEPDLRHIAEAWVAKAR
jgi:hypothetical protein